MTITIPKGFNRSFPPQFRTASSSYVWGYEISIDTPYILYDKDGNVSEDQKDWNKLIGVKHHYLQPKKSSLMVGFAYNVETHLYDLCYYWHDADGTRHWSETITSVKLKEKFQVWVNGGLLDAPNSNTEHAEIQIKTYHLVSPDGELSSPALPKLLFLPKGRKYKINTWFGGDNPAPSTMKFTIKQLR